LSAVKSTTEVESYVEGQTSWGVSVCVQLKNCYLLMC